MANLKDFIKKLDSEVSSIEEQNSALDQIEKTVLEVKQRQELPIEENAELVELTLLHVQQNKIQQDSIALTVDLIVNALKTIEDKLQTRLNEVQQQIPLKGNTGDKGRDGRDGKDGSNGKDGKDGKDGLAGPAGKDGNDGVSVVDANIDFDGSLVIYLSNGSEIDAGQILSPEVAQNIIINSGGSGTSQAVTDAIVSLQAQINALTGIDGTLGTMAQQDANAVAITGGTINGTTIGATTASTGRFSDLTDTGLTSGRVTYAGTGGNLTDSSNLTFNGTTLVANDITDTSLTATRVVYAGTGGNLTNAANFTYDGTNLIAGAIQNTPIGATTPSTVNATTITGQTARLNGSGQNFFPNTTTFAAWGLTGGTLTLSTATTDPFGGTSVYKLVANNGQDPSVGSSAILATNSSSLPAGALFTQSIYFKAAEFSALRLRNNSSGELYTFTIGVTPTATAGVLTPALTLISNGWYRASWSFIAGLVGSTGRTDNWSVRLASTGDGTSGIYVSSPQLEFGSTLSAYIPNTGGTVLYGTPTLSFSGVSEIGLLSNGALYLQPAGTGALQAQATTSTTAGGNARGANAVDWQTTRDNSGKVASGFASVLGGGNSNSSTNASSSVLGGAFNAAGGEASVVVAGSVNQALSPKATVVGGNANTAAGYYNFIGGGQLNSATSQSTVTTQAAATNGVTSGSTAVTLSGSNANIRVGQLITGTGMVSDTYVAAISGTSLTLSRNANATGTPTLSFFTPHGVVVGGGNNQATGSYSFIGGGGDAGTAANRNVASGDWSFVGGGRNNIASGLASFVGGGGTTGDVNNNGNTASGQGAVVVGGTGGQATGQFSSVLGGQNNRATGGYDSVLLGQYGTTRGIQGNGVFSSNLANPFGFVFGSSQAGLLLIGAVTTDATATALRSNGGAAGTNNQVILPNNSAYFFRGEVISGVTGGGNTKGWTIEGVIKRGANAASTALVGTPTVTSSFADAGAATWTIAVTADTTNGGLRVTFTGQAGTTIRTVCQIRTTEMTY